MTTKKRLTDAEPTSDADGGEPAAPSRDLSAVGRARRGGLDEEALAWVARWRGWFAGESPPPPRSADSRHRRLDERTGRRYGVRWGDDDQPLGNPAPPPLPTPGRALATAGGQAEAAADLVERWAGMFFPLPADTDPDIVYMARKRNRGNLAPMRPNAGADTFAAAWQGTLKVNPQPPVASEDPRYHYLWYKYRLYESAAMR